MRIADVLPLENHVLLVAAEDGAIGLFDIKPYLEGEAFTPLKDYEELKAVHNRGYFLEWACGADLSADTIEAHLMPAPPEIAKQLTRRRPNAARAARC